MLHPSLGNTFDVYDGQIKQISVKQINLMGESVEIWDIYANRNWFVSYAILSEVVKEMKERFNVKKAWKIVIKADFLISTEKVILFLKVKVKTSITGTSHSNNRIQNQ